MSLNNCSQTFSLDVMEVISRITTSSEWYDICLQRVPCRIPNDIKFNLQFITDVYYNMVIR